MEQEKPRVWALVSLFLAPAFVFANMYSTQAILPVLSDAFHVSAPTAGLSISVLVLAVAVGSLIYGPISDRIGRKPVMVCASLLVVIPTLLLGLSPNFAALVMLRAVQGLLMPGLTSVAISYVNEEFSGRGRGLAMGIYVSGLTLGGLFARAGSAALTGFFNWQVALLLFTLPTLVAALCMWRFLPDKRSSKNLDRGTMWRMVFHLLADRQFALQSLRDMRMHLRNRGLVGAFMVGFTSFFGFIGIFTYLPYYLTGPHFNLSTVSLGLVYLLWLTGIFSPIAGTIAGRIGSRRAIAGSMGIAATGLLITLIPMLPITLCGLGLLTLGMFSTVAAANLYLGEKATAAKGTAASMYLSLYYFGGSLGAVLPGFALLWAGWTGVVALCLGMVLIALASDMLLCR
ncbi:MAG TPA: MFS transporter [Ktedonobacteraceae bacterium]|nr:MFS transporter [Ktedonobacteraceae bacterium]